MNVKKLTKLYNLTDMKTNIHRVMLLLIFFSPKLLAQNRSGVAETTLSNGQTRQVTLTYSSANFTNTYLSYPLTTNQVVTVDTFTYGTVYATFDNGISNQLSSSGNTIFTGATNIWVAVGSQPGTIVQGYASFKLFTPSTNTASVTPANSVVIPSDATGPVQIVLECSADLVNWTSALPGLYGNTYSNRFFRVRAIAH